MPGLSLSPDGGPQTPPGRISRDEIARTIRSSENPIDESATAIRRYVKEFVQTHWQGRRFPSNYTGCDVIFINEWPWEKRNYAQIKPYDRLGAHLTAIDINGTILDGDAPLEPGEGYYDLDSLHPASSDVVVKRSSDLLEKGMELIRKKLPTEQLRTMESDFAMTKEDITFVVGVLQGMGRLPSMELRPAA